jgi:UDP-GlcNAc3NAcA epimerase
LNNIREGAFVPKIVTVLGARPQFIKASVVSSSLEAQGHISEIVIHTGQHFDANMSKVFFSELGMSAPKFNLRINSQGHGAMTGRMLIEIEKVLLAEQPDAVLVYGDTNSTLAGALAAAKLNIPVAHVEAGLRSFNVQMPEEINRVLTDRVSKWLFTPSATATRHLQNEGMGSEKILEVGDVMYDVALHHGARLQCRPSRLVRLRKSDQRIQLNGYCLATIHRAENTQDLQRLTAIVRAFTELAKEIPVCWPLHPRTRAVLAQAGQLERLARSVVLIDPVGYLDMVELEKFAALIATDSGGVQKEAFFYGVPCVTLRDETEWTELVDAGWNRLSPPTSSDNILTDLRAALGSKGQAIQPYGNGDAAQRIALTLGRALKST